MYMAKDVALFIFSVDFLQKVQRTKDPFFYTYIIVSVLIVVAARRQALPFDPSTG